MPRSLAVSAALHEELTVSLEDLLDEHDMLLSAKALLVRLVNKDMKTTQEAIFTVRQRLKGVDGEQAEIPGTEGIRTYRDPALGEVLRIIKPAVEAERRAEEARKAAKQKDLGLDDAVSMQADAKKGKGEPKSLSWEPAGDNLVAITPLGTYCIQPGVGPNEPAFTLLWTPPEGNSKKLDETATQPAAKDLARKDWLERNADAILKNAGHGTLTRDRGAPKKKRSHHKRRG